MGKTKPGDRVFALQASDGDTVEKFGNGVYLGKESPPRDVIGPFGPMWRDGVVNPKIQLDNGDIVWGCECWFGPESEEPKWRLVKEVSVADYRKTANEAWAKKVEEDKIRALNKRSRIGQIDPEALLLDGFDRSIIGTAQRCGQPLVVVYSRVGIIGELMDDGMTEEEAEEYFEFNIGGAWVGNRTPVIVEELSYAEA